MTALVVTPALADLLARLSLLADWVEDAACASLGAGADVFTADNPDPYELEMAESVCWRCPVRQECADYAAQSPSYGLWGASWHGPRARPRRAA